jgi:hypothetical protein
MTLVIGACLSKGIWVLTDRRVTFKARPPVDDAVKVFSLSAHGGTALFAYAGLGMTANGEQPSDWFKRITRAMRTSATVEDGVRVIAAAMNEHLPKHLQTLTWTSKVVDHGVLCLAVVKGKPRAYSLVMRVKAGATKPLFNVHELNFDKMTRIPISIFKGGSGASHVSRRELLTLFRARERGQISEQTVADRLAAICHRVHLREPTVGTRSIVAYRTGRGGGRTYGYDGTKLTPGHIGIPSIVAGMDLAAMTAYMQKSLSDHMAPHVAAIEALHKAGNKMEAAALAQKVMAEHKGGLDAAYRATWKPTDPTLK